MIPLLAAAHVALAVPSGPAPGAAPARVLTLDAALALERSHQPTLAEASANVRAAQARHREALAPFLPQLSGSVSAEHHADLGQSQALLAAAPRVQGAGTPGDFGTGTFGLTASQVIWDFGAGRSTVAAAGAQVDAAGDTLDATRLGADLAVREAYFAAWGDKRQVAVASESLSDQRAHERQVQAAVKIGTRPPSDLAQVEASVASARVQAINARDTYAIAKAQLIQAIGMPQVGDFEVVDPALPAVAGEGLPIERLVSGALAARPDRRSLDDQIRSARLSEQAAKLAWTPRIAAVAGVSADAQSQVAESNNWEAGVTMNWPLVSGGDQLARVKELQAELDSLRDQREALDQQIRLDVTQADLALRGARDGVLAAGTAVQEARISLKLAEGRYAVGLGSVIELDDAQQQLATAEGQQIQEQMQLDDARAQLLKALGRPA